MAESVLNKFHSTSDYLQGKRGLYQAPLGPLAPLAPRGHRASLESRVFPEATLLGLWDPLDPPGLRDLQVLKVQQVYNVTQK